MNLPRNFLHSLAMFVVCIASVSAFAQTPSTKEPRVVLKGYDPVAYFTDGKPAKGTADINYDWDDGRYLFSSAAHRQTFAAAPDRYAPQFAGFCTGGIAKGMKVEANPELFMVVNGKLYTFSSQKARDAAIADPSLFARAEKNWSGRQ